MNYNGIRYLNLFKAKNRISFVILNIMLSDFLISSIGIILDIIGMFQTVGSSLRGKSSETFICQFEGIFYMSVG